eukprot:GHUV01020855.1.p2 GENE.GHUV01020855.1~~GHUV01020855.1.p2  ORF type:complete len:109 (+),score=3.45 GHUV01020855.1:446-772(+)
MVGCSRRQLQGSCQVQGKLVYRALAAYAYDHHACWQAAHGRRAAVSFRHQPALCVTYSIAMGSWQVVFLEYMLVERLVGRWSSITICLLIVGRAICEVDRYPTARPSW